MSTVLGIIFGVVTLLAVFLYFDDNAYRRYSRAEMALDSKETDLEAASNKMLGGQCPRVEAIGRMHTRYCLRRQLGACLKAQHATTLPRDLFLKSGSTLLKVTCDCKNCEMRLTLPSTK